MHVNLRPLRISGLSSQQVRTGPVPNELKVNWPAFYSRSEGMLSNTLNVPYDKKVPLDGQIKKAIWLITKEAYCGQTPIEKTHTMAVAHINLPIRMQNAANKKYK